jgi:hypothetical protein
VPALALASLAALPPAPAAAAEPDPQPLAAGSSWLAAQVTDGLVHNDQYDFDDYGLSIDAALALDAVGGHDGVVQDTADAIATNLDFYVGYDYFPVPAEGEPRHVIAGSIAKALAFAQAAGRNPAAYGGHDLVAELEGQVVDTGPALGRIRDTFNPGVANEVDFANSFGQLYAVQGLDAAGSTLAEAATEFLVAQQCDEGFFRQDFAPVDAAEQDCDADPAAEPSTDVTALAVLALLPQADDTDVQPVIDAAVDWLVEAQADNGGFGSGSDIPTPNTNSTGLAARALGEHGEVAAAERAAAFVRAHQADDPAPCTSALSDDQGAIAYDIPALEAGRADGITVELQDQWRRATVQALPALQWAPAAGPASTIALKDFYRAGSKVKLVANGFAPGDYVCFRRGSAGVGLGLVGFGGTASTTVTLPKGTARRTYQSASGEAEGQPLVLHVLDATKLPLELKRTVARGGKQAVRISGLAKGESWSVTFRGKRVDTGTANAKGRAVARFGVGRKTGAVRVLVIGEFKNRRSSRAFTVTR